MFHWYGSGGHQWLDRKTEATETSKASVDRSYGNGNYVGSLRLLNAVSICPAAGQVVENTPCPAVKFLLIFSLSC